MTRASCFVGLATVAGTTQPTWPTATGATVVDGTVTWQEAGNGQTPQLADPVGLPGAALLAGAGDLEGGTTYF